MKNDQKNTKKGAPSAASLKNGLGGIDKTELINIAMLCLAALAVLFVMWTFTGKWPWVSQPYNSYMLQAQSWLSGRLDLGKNYKHLELAIFPSPPDLDAETFPDYCKFFVSFPPFPSYLMVPFALVRWYTADGMIAVVSALFALVYAYKLMRRFEVSASRAILFSFLLTIGSNWVFISQSAWVWFIAQNLAFTLSLMAIYYAVCGKPGLSLAFWACAVGCRPLDAVYFPVLLYFIYTSCGDPDARVGDNIKRLVREKWMCVIPVVIIGGSYMLLNMMRFGNPFEFGHNYLPEFASVDTGQFNMVYVKENLPHLWWLPKVSFTGAWEYQKFNGFSMFMVSPLFISYIVYTVYALIKRRIKPALAVLIFAVIVLELVLITAHKTMGGWQFGNRYTNDVLPLAFLGLAASLPKEKTDWESFNYILLFWGAALNIIGSTVLFMSA